MNVRFCRYRFPSTSQRLCFREQKHSFRSPQICRKDSIRLTRTLEFQLCHVGRVFQSDQPKRHLQRRGSSTIRHYFRVTHRKKFRLRFLHLAFPYCGFYWLELVSRISPFLKYLPKKFVITAEYFANNEIGNPTKRACPTIPLINRIHENLPSGTFEKGKTT